MNEIKVICQVEIEGKSYRKNAYIPANINKNDLDLSNESVRNYFRDFGYENIGMVKILSWCRPLTI